MTGMIATPTIAKIETALSALVLSSIVEWSPINAIYIKKSINVDVKRASHTHQVPHVGFPQIDPVKRVSKTKLIPIGAADFIIMPEIFALQITLMKPQKAMNIKIDSPIIAEGT